MRRSRPLTGLLGRSLLSVALLTTGMTFAAALAAAPAASAATAQIETDSQNPVTAEPPVGRPPTHACTQTIADAFPSNDSTGAAQNFSGTLSPPADCPGPWSKVVLDWTTSVQGRQYDRSGSLDIGNTMVYFGTTYEPDQAGNTYHFAKDLTEYSSLFKTPQTFNGGIVNYTSDVYTGVYVQTVTITYYEADRANPAPTEPDAIVGLGSQDADPGQPTVTMTAAGLPRNIVRAYLEVYIKGNGCDEQWFTDVPNDVASQFPSAGMCGDGPYREVDASIDAKPAGVTQYFPYIYTGGIVPTLWRPIPAVGTFDMSPELMDVTPFVGELVDGGSHSFALTVANAGDVWNLSANLILYTDHGAATTSGALTRDTIAPSAAMSTKESTAADGSVTADVGAQRSWVTSGYVNTSQGRETTTVTQNAQFYNADVVSQGGFAQDIKETDQGQNRSVTTGGHGLVQETTHDWSYPITVDATFQITDDDNFNLAATVDMTRQLSDTQTTLQPGRAPTTTHSQSDDQVWSTATDVRADGVTTASSGQAWQRYQGTDDVPGQWYNHYLAASNGYITADKLKVTG